MKAHGAKWRKWYNSQRLWRESRRKIFPYQYQENILIEFDVDATYWISNKLQATFKRVRDETFGLST